MTRSRQALFVLCCAAATADARAGWTYFDGVDVAASPEMCWDDWSAQDAYDRSADDLQDRLRAEAVDDCQGKGLPLRRVQWTWYSSEPGPERVCADHPWPSGTYEIPHVNLRWWCDRTPPPSSNGSYPKGTWVEGGSGFLNQHWDRMRPTGDLLDPSPYGGGQDEPDYRYNPYNDGTFY